METRKIVIAAPNGMHARPAGELAKLAKSFAPTRIMLCAAGKEVNAASVLSILSLGLKQGTELEVTANGGDEKTALESVTRFIENIRE